MNTKNLTLTLAVAAAATLTTLTLNAAEPLHSPRARDTQVRTMTGITQGHLQRGLFAGSPRGREQQTRTLSNTNNDLNVVARTRKIVASPRALEQSPWLVTR